MGVTIDLLHPDTDLEDVQTLVKQQLTKIHSEKSYKLTRQAHRIAYDDTISREDKETQIFDILIRSAKHSTQDADTPDTPEDAYYTIAPSEMDEYSEIIIPYLYGCDISFKEAERARRNFIEHYPNQSLTITVDIA